MFFIQYNFDDSDIETCLFALTKLPLLHKDSEISELQIATNEQCCISVSKKLSNRHIEKITANELRVLCCCITFCNLICQGTISTDFETYQSCAKHKSILDKLDNELSSQIF